MPDTYGRALGLVGVSIPAHLSADAEVPVLTGPQAQGDVLVVPVEPPDDLEWGPLPAHGVQVVHGEATGNTHWLHRGFGSPGVGWAPAEPWEAGPDGLVLGHLYVPDGQSALLIHTDEHGANGVGPGRYAVRRKREADATAQPGAWDDRFVED